MILSVDDYRRSIALDEPFLPPEVRAEDSEARLTNDLLAVLSAEAGVREPSGSARQALYRLLISRTPRPFPTEVLSALDRLMWLERCRRPVTEVMHLPCLRAQGIGGVLGEGGVLWRGDITTLRVDAIVNAANQELLGCFVPFHVCVDNAIHAVAGPRLREDCAKIMALQGGAEPTGGAKITRGYHLPSSFVLHTVGPILRARQTTVPQHMAAELEASYRACLELVEELPGIRSIAFCSISTGVFGFPAEPAAAIAIGTVERFLKGSSLERVVFNVFSERDLGLYRRALQARSF